MKKTIAKILIFVMTAGLFFSGPQVYADAAAKPYLSLGADLNKEEKEKVLEYLQIDDEKLKTCQIGTVTNEEEHKYLGSYISSKVIGTRALSSVLVELTDSGEGIDVETRNITYCTGGMYRNALATAGVKDADIKVAGPFPLTGTAALVGVMKAYEEMTGEEISEESKDAATDELVTTGEVAESIGDTNKAEELIALIKEKVVSGDLGTKEEIKEAIDTAGEELKVSLSEEDRQLILSLMEKISELDLDMDQLYSQAKNVYEKLKEAGIDVKSEGFWNSLKDLVNRFFDWISGLFS